MSGFRAIGWLKEPKDRDYAAAQSYLSLLFEESVAKDHVQKLKGAGMASFKAKDVFRASGLPPLDVSNAHVVKDREKISEEKPLSPLLLVRDPQNGNVIVADGYHRLCAVYYFDEDADISCKIV